MGMFILSIHIIACILLILIVLLQTGKGADMGASFGGASSQGLFGGAGPASFLSKITTGIAVIFMLTSLSLAYLAGNKSNVSVMPDTKPPIEQKAKLPIDQKADNTSK
ncbi:MAG: preprotein translocase subunit SecG [Desulfobacteraceae bacterium 4572_130]|nr:MAG: preprotein translocase subunit SecG [Desulfobacteraceae bacterium 4572_130]